MSEIRDMYEQIKLLQEKLIKTKLQEAIKAIKEKRELSIEEKSDFSFGPDDVELLKNILAQKVDDIDYDETTYVSFYNYSHLATSIFKIDGDYISIVPYESVKITDIEALRKIFDEHRYSEERKSKMEDLLNGLVDVDLEQLKRRTQERMPNKSIEPEETIEEEVQENKAKDEMFRRIVLEKIKYIESSSIEDIPYDCFTQEEALNLLKYLRGNEGYIVSREVEEDTRSVEEEDAGYPPQIELVCYDTIRLGDKVLYFEDSSRTILHGVLEITDEKSYVRSHDYRYIVKSLPEKTLTVSQIEQFMQGKNELTKGVEHTAEEIGEGVQDLTQGELGDALTAITDIGEPQKDPHSLE